MNAIRVQYTVRDDYVATNEANIQAVMAELRALGDVGVKYAAFRPGGGSTFVHVVMFEDDAKKGVVPGLAAFQRFQSQLKASGLVSPPAQEAWSGVAASFGA